MKHIFLFIIISIIISLGCNDSEKSIPKNTKLSKDFLSFYDKFHEDTIFQLNHITFPLDGKRTENNEFIQWKRENWAFHKKISPDGAFYNKYIKISDTIYEEFIIEKQTHAFLKRRWAKITDTWYLVYYQDLSF